MMCMADDEEPNEEIYSESGREKLVEDDEIEPWEEGFMEGADDDGQQAKCRKCGKLLTGTDVVEREINDELCWFCSEECAEKYEEEHSK